MSGSFVKLIKELGLVEEQQFILITARIMKTISCSMIAVSTIPTKMPFPKVSRRQLKF